MKHFKRITSLLLAVVMVMSVMALNVFADNTEVSVKFDYNYTGSNKSVVVKIAAGETVTPPENVKRMGYVLKGWSTVKYGGDLFDFSKPITEDVTLYAQWRIDRRGQASALDKTINDILAKMHGRYTVTFETNGGTEIAPIEVKYGATIVEVTPIKAHYIFLGWYTDAELTEKFDFATEIKEDITLYADWKKESYTVSFETSGGTAVDSQTVEYGDSAVKPADPTRDDYTFIGWYTDSGLTAEYDFTTAVEGDLVLYAKWEEVVVFDGCNIIGVITIADADTDMTNNAPLEGAEISLEVSSSENVVATSNSRGEYTLENIPVGTFTLTVTKEGYIPATAIITVTEIDSEIIYNITIEAIPEEHAGIGNASGYVYDVATGYGVPNMTLYIREGLNNTSGDIVMTLTTSGNGSYIAENLPAGNYTVQVVDERTGITDEERYITASFNIKVLGDETIENQNGYISNGIAAEELRIVLTWGELPRDLDSHLVGPTADGGKFHVYYDNKTHGSEADLDWDDIDSYGPETVTIHSYNEGVYTYAIHDYTNKSSSYSTAMANSGAQVNVYRGAQLIATYNVPTDMDGTLWTVFTYNPATRQISTVNTMSYDTTSGGSLMMLATVASTHINNEITRVEFEDISDIIFGDIVASEKDA